MKWDVKLLLVLFVFSALPVKSFGMVFTRSTYFNKIPEQAREPVTKRQVKINNNPFLFFDDAYRIPVRSFNELDIFLFQLTSTLDYIEKHSEAFKDFGYDNNLSIMKCFEVMSPQWSEQKCWYHISNKDLKKLSDRGYGISDDYVKYLYDVLNYREKLNIKIISLLHRFDNKKSKRLINDINDYYGMSEKYNKDVVDYTFRDIYKNYLKNIKYVNSLIENERSIVAKKRLTDWLNFLKKYKNLHDFHEVQVLRIVNRQFRSVRYHPDDRVWGVEDYHATPYELLLKGAGDCEDYAYAKYITLLALGFNYSDLRLRYVIHPSLGAHMVTVYSAQNGKDYILDNLKDNIYEAHEAEFSESVYEYDLIYINAINNKSIKKTLAGSVDKINSWKQRFLGLSQVK